MINYVLVVLGLFAVQSESYELLTKTKATQHKTLCSTLCMTSCQIVQRLPGVAPQKDRPVQAQARSHRQINIVGVWGLLRSAFDGKVDNQQLEMDTKRVNRLIRPSTNIGSGNRQCQVATFHGQLQTLGTTKHCCSTAASSAAQRSPPRASLGATCGV